MARRQPFLYPTVTALFVAAAAGCAHTPDDRAFEWSTATGPKGDLTAIWGSAADDVWVTGSAGPMHWTGAAWSPVALADCFSGTPNGVWGISRTDRWISSCATKEPVHHATGDTWAAYAINDNRSVDAFWGSGPNDVWGATLSDNGYLGHWDGSLWTHVDSVHMGAIWGSAPNDLWIAGNTLTHHTSAPDVVVDLAPLGVSPSTCTLLCLHAIWGDSASDIWAVGEQGAALHYDGSAWTRAQTPVTSALYAVWGSKADDVWAFGDAGTILHYDGASWSVAPSPTTAPLRAAWGDGANDVWIVGSGGALLRGTR